ncbi:MAG: helix-turn-helix domain-containing protein, partial [Verrucomicrobiales bacterium]|nr:helix-turn-helix domain-containing protein [Verrucomicrobiales bacterium]
ICARHATRYSAYMRNLLTKKEVADALRVSTRTVCRYVKLGWLVPIRLSEQVVRFDQDEVERFISEGPGARPEA